MFIYEDKINKKVCSDLINIFEKSDKKESIDNDYTKMNQVVINLYDPILEPYIKCLNKVKNKYIKKYNQVDKGQMPWNLFPYIKIQKYNSKESYSGWHCEAEGKEGNEKKILVFTTYLNTIKKVAKQNFFIKNKK
jgi:hypothetical protein